MTDKTQRRRSSMLATLHFYPMLTLIKLKDEMELTHGVLMSSDLVRADLSWLAEMGLARFDGRDAQITERGRDVARQSALWPGEAP